MLAPHTVVTVDTEQCGRCDAIELRLRREEECVFACVYASEFVMVGWIPPESYVHSKGEIYSSASQGYGLATELMQVTALADMNGGKKRSFQKSMA